jgi:beta-lactamase regulating signal transducer with metallopeptidase domain
MTWLHYLRPDTALLVNIFLALAHFLWQGAAVAALVWLVGPLLRRRSASFRYNAYFAALVLVAICPVVNLVLISHVASPRVVPAQVASNTTPGAVTDVPNANDGNLKPAASPNSLQSPSIHISENPPSSDHLTMTATYAVAAYGIGVMAMLSRLVFAVLAGRSLCRTTRQPRAELSEVFVRLARQMQVKRDVPLGLCDRIATPAVVGILRPVVLLPISAVSELSTSQLESILVHELAHVRRLDVVVNMLQRLVEVFLFFHPAVWFISGRIRIERENCCDDWVLSLGASPVEYAGALIRIAEASLPAPLAALAAVEPGSRLRRRVLRIIGSDVQDAVLPRGGIVVAVSLAVVALMVIGLGVSSQVARAQSSKSAPASQTAGNSGADTPVARGLEWLAKRVDRHGKFATTRPFPPAHLAVPSLAGLAFLASGSTTANGPYAEQLWAIEQHVLASQDPSGLLTSMDQGPMYEHGYAMLFLAECQMKHPEARVREALVKAVSLTEKAINSEGGWRYRAEPLDADISVTACQLNALLATKAAGVDVNQRVIDRALAYVRKCQNPDGGFSYMAGQGGFGGSGGPRTAAAVAVLLHGGLRVVDESVVKAIRYSENMGANPNDRAGRGHYFYGTFYKSQWLLSVARDTKAAERLSAEILASQRPDGSWTDAVSDEYATASALIVLLSRDRRLWIYR